MAQPKKSLKSCNVSFSKELAILKREAQQPPRASKADAKVRQMNSSDRRLNDIGYVSPLRKLSPVLIDGIVCVGGRLQRAAISAAAKYPPILPGDHPVTGLIVKHHHKFWPLSDRSSGS